VSNVIKFPDSAMAHVSNAAVDLHLGPALFGGATDHAHAVQFYDSDEFLFDTVGRFLAAGLQAGDRIVVIASEEHREGFMRRLEDQGGHRAIQSGRLMLLDARETMSKFMVGDMPDADLFRDMIDRVITRAQDGHAGVRIRAFGEMVDLLWREGNSRAAMIEGPDRIAIELVEVK